MSALLAAVTGVVATPTPSPLVVHDTVKTIINSQTPAQVLQLAQIGSVALAGLLTSIVHLVVTRQKLSGNVNRLLFTLFAAIAGVTTMWLTGDLKFDSTGATTGLTALLAFAGSAQGMKMLMDFVGSLQTTTSPDTGAAAPVLAGDTEAGV